MKQALRLYESLSLCSLRSPFGPACGCYCTHMDSAGDGCWLYRKVLPGETGVSTMATSIKIDDELKTRIQHLASLRQRSAHWIMREAITQYVEREEACESFKQEALASWASYQETGLHLTGQEARA